MKHSGLDPDFAAVRNFIAIRSVSCETLRDPLYVVYGEGDEEKWRAIREVFHVERFYFVS